MTTVPIAPTATFQAPRAFFDPANLPHICAATGSGREIDFLALPVYGWGGSMVRVNEILVQLPLTADAAASWCGRQRPPDRLHTYIAIGVAVVFLTCGVFSGEFLNFVFFGLLAALGAHQLGRAALKILRGGNITMYPIPRIEWNRKTDEIRIEFQLDDPQPVLAAFQRAHAAWIAAQK